MGKNKLIRFAEMAHFSNTYEFPENIAGTWHKEVFKNENPICLELACGRGEYTVGLSAMHPERNYIGIDIKGARLWRGAKTCMEEGRSNAAFLRAYIDQLPAYFGKDEVDEIWITFPDPHLKPGKAKKRLTSWRYLRNYTALMRDGGTIRLKTDDPLLYHFTVAVVENLNLPLIEKTEDINKTHPDHAELAIRTTYETKWRSEGKPIHYIAFTLDHSKLAEENYKKAEAAMNTWLAEHNPPREDLDAIRAAESRQTKK